MGFVRPVFSASNDLSIVTVSDMVVVMKAKPYEGTRPLRTFQKTEATIILYGFPKEMVDVTNQLYGVSGISGAGISTGSGDVQAPLHFATIKSASTGKEFKLYVRMATTESLFNRSGLAWAGDKLEDVKYGYACMAARRLKGEKQGEMTALMEVVFPEQKEAFVVFIGYNTSGALTPAFSTTSFERHTQLVENWRTHGP